jgi:alpha-maltose-1-phosphate synthase
VKQIPHGSLSAANSVAIDEMLTLSLIKQLNAKYSRINMNILLIQLIGSGGAQLYTAQLFQALSKKGNNVFLILGDYLFNKNQYSENCSRILPFHTSPRFLIMFFVLINPKTYYDLIKLVNLTKPDIIHIVFEDPVSALLSFFLSRKYPVIVTEHDPKLHDGEMILIRILFKFSRFITRNVSKAIIVHGKLLQNFLHKQGVPLNRIHIVPHGDFSYFTKWSDPTIKEELVLLYFGLISEYKGIEYLILASPKIITQFPEVKIIIAGQGDFSPYRKLITIQDNFEIQNTYIPDEKVARLFQRAAVVVLPYTDASQSGVIPIAYSFKKPVIATNVGSLPEVIDDGKTGFIIPPRNSELLAESAITLLSDELLRKEMGENAYKKMIEELSWDKNADLLHQIYFEVIRRSKKR